MLDFLFTINLLASLLCPLQTESLLTIVLLQYICVHKIQHHMLHAKLTGYPCVIANSISNISTRACIIVQTLAGLSSSLSTLPTLQ